MIANDATMSCDMQSFVSKHFNMLIDIFKSDLENLGIESVHTKCLYTAVTMFYLLAGNRAKAKCLHCYVNNVKQRMSALDAESRYAFLKEQVSAFKKDVLQSSCNNNNNTLKKGEKRKIFFVMLTNSPLKHSKDSTKEEEHFPGHVFIIDKQMRNSCEATYSVYQSYINEYTLQDYSGVELDEKELHMNYSQKRMKTFLNDLGKLILSKKWTEKNIKFWKDFTLVDVESYKDYNLQPHINFCYISLPARRCQKEIVDALKEKMAKGELTQDQENIVRQLK